MFCIFLKILLSHYLLISADLYQSYDDVLYIKIADNILNKKWLGDYSHLTLIKGIGYPLWLSLNSYLGLPLLLSQGIFYIFSGLVLLFSIKRIIKNEIVLSLLFIIYIFNPFIETRVLREGIYPALSICILAGYIGLYIYRFEKIFKLVVWAFISGFSLLFFWITREEGVWIAPLISILTLYTIFGIMRASCLKKFFRILICCFPVLICASGIQIISTINYFYYGVYTTVELKSNPFLSAYGALTRVEHANFRQYLDVPLDVRQKIYSISPSFNQLKVYLDEGKSSQINAWKNLTCSMYPSTCGDIGGCWFMWSLREAANLAGHYKSAPEAERYYKQLASEINSACDNKFLDCLSPRETLTSPYRTEYLPMLFKTYRIGIDRILSIPIPDYLFFKPVSYGLGNQIETEKLFIRITRAKLAPSNPSQNGSNLHLMIFVTKVYRYLLMHFKIISLLYLLVLFKYKTKISFITIINFGIILSLGFRLFILSLIDVTSFPTLFNWTSYIVPFYPLILIFIVLVAYDACFYLNTIYQSYYRQISSNQKN